jgi:hypothetical protein
VDVKIEAEPEVVEKAVNPEVQEEPATNGS